MARKKKDEDKFEVAKIEIIEELPIKEEKEEEVKEPEVEPLDVPPLAQPIKPPKYYHVDQFLQTAIPLFGLNNMQARGFKARMRGRQYQEDMNVFVNELKQYLNIQ